MDYENFKWSLLEEVKGMTEQGTQVRLHRIPCANGLQTDAISVNGGGKAYAPAVAVKPYYERYSRGRESLHAIAGRIVENQQASIREDLGTYGSLPAFEDIAERVYVRLMSIPLNRELLKKVPYIEILDLAAVFYMRLDLSRIYDAMILVNNEDLCRWHLSVEELKAAAIRNTIRQKKPALIPMWKILGETFEEESNREMPPMYVLTNSERWHGAAVMLYPNLLKTVSEMLNGSFFVLPSSVHEVIVLPDDMGYSPDMLRDLVETVNTNEVSPAEVLSNSVYRFEAGGSALSYA